MPNLLVFRDIEKSASPSPAILVSRINNLCGGIVSDPRPDLHGEYVIDDILSSQVVDTGTGWAIIAVVSLRREAGFAEALFSETGIVAEVGRRTPVDELLPIISGAKAE